jgi:hypothetical protein
MNPAPSPERLHELLELHDDGRLTWRIRTSNRISVGDRAGHLGKLGYRLIKLDGSLQLEHRIVWAMCHGKWPSDTVDHANCIRDDNRIGNLREAGMTEQNCNMPRRKDNKSGYKGVSWQARRKKWIVQICRKGKRSVIGLFDDKEEAAAAYAGAAARLFGSFARIE